MRERERESLILSNGCKGPKKFRFLFFMLGKALEGVAGLCRNTGPLAWDSALAMHRSIISAQPLHLGP